MSVYVVAKVTVNDPETYKKYAEKTPALLEKHGGKFLVRGGNVETLEGELFKGRVVVIEFPTQEALQNFYNDPDYQAAKLIRQSASEGQFLAVDGV